MSNQLLPCPFCGGADVHAREFGIRIVERFAQCRTCEISVPLEVWNRRATQPAAGEPVYQLRNAVFKRTWREVDQVEYDKAEGLSGYERRILWTAPPAAAHGDEAVRKDATESAIQRACKELPEGWSMQIELERGAGDVTLFNAWDIVVGFGQDFESSISEQVEAAIDAAMRAQGDGEVQ